MEKIEFYDTTMRDWQQSPWASITNDSDYFKYIELANKVWFDIIEAWFPSSSTNEFNRVNKVSEMSWSWEISPIIAWLCQLIPKQVDKTIRCLEPSIKYWKSLLHTYFPVDPALLKASVPNAKKRETVKKVFTEVKKAVEAWMIVQFSPEWYSMVWTNFKFCTDLIIATVTAWAKYINCPDTRWSADRFQWKDYYVNNMIKHKQIIDKLFPGNEVIWSLHNHNDFWEAVENTIEWIVNWVGRKVECTVCWVWERAWNADSLQIAMRMKKFHSNDFDTSHINTKFFREIWDHVSKVMLPTQPHYPITWANAMKHTSWWHVNAILKNPLVYQPYDPAEIWWEIELIFWSKTWWALAYEIIQRNWWKCSKEESKKVATYVREYITDNDIKKWILDEEFMKIYNDYKLKKSNKAVQITWYTTKKISKNEIEVTFSWLISWEKNITIRWNTPFKALKKYLSGKYPWFSIEHFNSESESKSENSIAISQVIISFENKKITWIWRDIDIETSSLKALANAFNEFEEESKKI